MLLSATKGGAGHPALGSQLLAERADKSLVGMGTLAWFAIVASIVFPLLLGVVEAWVRRTRAAS